MSARDDQAECRATLLGETPAAIHVCKTGALQGAKPESWWIPRSQIGYLRIDRSDNPAVPDHVVFSCPEWLIESKGAWAIVP